MKWNFVLLALILVAAACSGSESDSTSTPATATTSIPTTSTAPFGLTTTSPPDAATTTTAGGASSGSATFAISRVVFGDDGYVSVTNVGSADGNLEGWQLCQRPGYYRIDSVVVAAGETVHFATGTAPNLPGQVIETSGRFGRFGAGGGEIGLYVDNSFGSASAIRSYVEWGSSDHGRSSVAVAAGIWVEGGFVRSEGAPGLAATVPIPTSPADWATS